MRLRWIVFLAVWSTFVYAPICHWVWAPNGWLHTMGALREVIRRALTSIFRIPGSPERSQDHHRAIREAIAARDADAARAEMLAHLVRVESDVHKALITRG